MLIKKNIQIKNSAGDEIDIDIRHSQHHSSIPVIFAHGFNGFKDWGGFPYMMEQLAEGGYYAISFNFSHNGVSKETPMDFNRLDLFAQNTFSKELDDLNTVINYFDDNSKEHKININSLALIGHSRGGGAVILQTARDKRIKALVTLASVSYNERYGKEQIRRWKEQGYFEIENGRTKQMMRMNVTLLEDIETNSEKLNIKKAISEIKVPVLIIHGKEDLAVKSEEAIALYENSDKTNTELVILENTGHTFGITHPPGEITPAFEEVITKIKEFLKVKLS